MAKTFEKTLDSFHHCVECGFLFHCGSSCLERSPVTALSGGEAKKFVVCMIEIG